MTTRARSGLTLAAAISLVLLAAACTSAPAGSTPPASAPAARPAADRMIQLEPALVGCFIRHGVIGPARVRDQSWYRNGRVTVDRDFALWWRDNEALPVKADGQVQQLDDVARHAAQDGTWPSICGAMPSPSMSS